MIEVGSLEYKVSNKFADNVDCRHNSVWKSRFQVGARFFDIFSKGSDILHILFRLLLESLNSYVVGQNLQYQRYRTLDPGSWIHVTVYTDPYPVPHETTSTVYH